MPQPQGTNLQLVKWQNRAVVLETLWRHQPISRKDLADLTRLTAATLTNIISEFLAAGLVQEIGPGEPGRGRRPTLLAFVGDHAYLLGINLSRTELSIGVFNLNLDCKHLLVHPIARSTDPAETLTLVHLLRQTVGESRVAREKIVGIGFSAPGPSIRVSDRVAFFPPGYDEWSSLPFDKIIANLFKLPIWFENDANANALAEHWLGAGQAYNNFIYVESHSGLGSGIILNGLLYRGSTGVAGELGHTSINHHGPRCSCGNYGCVELYSSGPAVVEHVRAAYAGGRATMLAQTAGPQLRDLTFDQVIDAALQGDSLAVEVIRQASRDLALSLVNAINLIDPEAVVIGYKLNRAGELCLREVREIIEQQAITPAAVSHLRVLSSTLREPVGVQGAACRALIGLLQTPHLLLTHLEPVA